jgi:hypothetical protein
MSATSKPVRRPRCSRAAATASTAARSRRTRAAAPPAVPVHLRWRASPGRAGPIAPSSASDRRRHGRRRTVPAPRPGRRTTRRRGARCSPGRPGRGSRRPRSVHPTRAHGGPAAGARTRRPPRPLPRRADDVILLSACKPPETSIEIPRAARVPASPLQACRGPLLASSRPT